MPTYEYKCANCEHMFEQFQSITAGTLKKCPSCGKAKLNRLIGAGAAVIFKGNGFYQTDYRSEGYKSSAKSHSETTSSSTSTESKSDTKSEAKSETKPETKAESKPAEKKTSPEKSKPKKSAQE